MSPRRHLAVVALLILIGAAINLPVAIFFVRNVRFPPTVKPVEVGKAGSGGVRWSETTPKSQPQWPEPTRGSIYHTFGHTRYHLYTIDPANEQQMQLSMQSDFYGWPLPCLAETNRWWPWDDPTWKTSEQPELPMHLVWSGVLLNPLMFAMSIWLLFLGIPATWVAARSYFRRRRGLCVKCAYPLVPSGLCPECGRENSPVQPAAVLTQQ